ncbi:MAG: serine/threonine protein kinase, partial [Planctomycetes bacterium]|nr:serine/threonine protein kinase [Planctomycetota bacterium]
MTELPAVGEGTTLDLLPAAGAAGGGPAGPAPALERLVVLGRLGAGGMGTVWRARQLGLGREVALKVLSGHRLDSLEARERFHLEAVAAANLDHPGIVRVHAFGEHAGLPWFVMELVEGPSLARLLEEGGPPGPLQAARWVAEAARAVDHAHRRGVVHRDLKPANLLLGGDGRLRVTDFGVARVEGPLAGAVPREPTEEGISLGTPAYMAPEQRLGDRRRVGPTTDVYALGLVLRECAGEPPGAGLEAVVRRATAFQPEARYPTALALAEDLEAWLATQPRERPLRAAAWPRWRRLAAALASVAAFGAAAGVGAWRGSPGAPEVAGAPAGRGGAARTALAREALGRPLETRAALEEALAADPADREALEAFVLWAAIHQEPARAGTAWRRLERLHDAASFAGLGERVGHLPGVSRE